MTITSRLLICVTAVAAFVAVLGIHPVSAQDTQNPDSPETEEEQLQSQNKEVMVKPEERDIPLAESLEEARITIYADDNFRGRS